MQFDVVTLFPRIFDGYLKQSLLNKAIKGGLTDVRVHDLRQWSREKHNSVDDRPFGGGPGMVIRVEPVVECVEQITGGNPLLSHIILLTPRGRRLNQQIVEELQAKPRLIMLCGRYEGFDQRVVDILQPDEVSIGDFILNGGEVAAMVVIDSVVRLVPGVLGDDRSAEEDSFSGPNRLLEFPHYTRPREYRGHVVPEVLLSGDHERIAHWRQQQSYKTTKSLRADLL